MEHTYGRNHLGILRIRAKLAQLMVRRGHHKRAETEFRSAVAELEEQFGIADERTIGTIFDMVRDLVSLEQYENAETWCKRCLIASEAARGVDRPDTSGMRMLLAEVLVKQARLNGAEETCRQALEARQHKLGPRHPLTLYSMEWLAYIFETQGNLEQAFQIENMVYQSSANALGPKDPLTKARASRVRRVAAQLKERDGTIAADVEQFALSIGEESTDEDDAGQRSDEQSSGSGSDNTDINEEESDGWETESSANSDDGPNDVKENTTPVT